MFHSSIHSFNYSGRRLARYKEKLEQHDRQRPSSIHQELRHAVKGFWGSRDRVLGGGIYRVIRKWDARAATLHTSSSIHHIVCIKLSSVSINTYTPFQFKRNVWNQIPTHSLRLHYFFPELNCVTPDSPSPASPAHRLSALGIGYRVSIGSIIYTNYKHVTLRGLN